MMQIKIGQQYAQTPNQEVSGEFVEIEGKEFYKIAGVDGMPPFFMTLVSPYDHWLFVASNGGISAGRGDNNQALFPYYTDDKIVDNAPSTGPKTIVRVSQGANEDSAFLWEPFDDRLKGLYRIERNLYKSLRAEELIFEEINLDLGLGFRYSWAFSKTYGFIKRVELKNLGDQDREIDCLDGMENLLPFGVDGLMQDRRSTLVDAYKKNELDSESGLSVFSLSSNIVDKAEPSESLKATVVWSSDKPSAFLLSSNQLEAYRMGADVETETFTKAVKAASFGHRKFSLASGNSRTWFQVADVGMSTAKVHHLKKEILSGKAVAVIAKELEESRKDLEALVASSDGLQCTGDRLVQSRHYGNVLYNIMRGGVFEEAYRLDRKDFFAYLKKSNAKLWESRKSELKTLPETFDYDWFQSWLVEKADADLRRLGVEYLPLSFSRRHGDPSRPWNYFNIQRFDENGDKILNYEGNWRDIFQNWEALAYSYPRFIEGMIFKFLNASTIDGYNPYRIEKNGIDWEVIEPHDPWSFIGYWGDHQLIYLLRLLEHCEAHYPGKLKELTKEFSFVYADVPYRLKSHAEIVADPQDTIDFDDELNRAAEARYAEMGTDGKLIWQQDAPLRANLAEKLLLTVLTKVYNLVPEGGVWMNTQRPEWNDANNALVGNGLSMVTLYYLRRFLRFMESWLATQESDLHVNGALMDLFLEVSEVINDYSSTENFNDSQRKDFVDRMGHAGERYRNRAYASDLGTMEALSVIQSRDFCARTIRLLDRSIKQNKKDDGLYHAYNLIKFEGEDAQVDYLYEMLEGQVGVLTSETLSPEEAVDVLNGLKSSSMFRPDQYSYMLYPDRVLPAFLAKNSVSADQVAGKKLTAQLMELGPEGNYHFKGHLNNAKDLKADFDFLSETGLADAVGSEASFWYELYEDTFIHRAFTGRSGTFYGYEGLGSIYWHMVSKLLLAVQENLRRAYKLGSSAVVIGHLMDHYYEIRAGIGANKSPELYGAFPFDAYSHTPSTAGAQQPGMTGQVKEDIISRWAELGIEVQGGEISLNPFFLSDADYLKEDRSFHYLDVLGDSQELDLKIGSMSFTYCNVPFIYQKAEENAIEIHLQNGERVNISGLNIDAQWSGSIFKRDNQIKLIRVSLGSN